MALIGNNDVKVAVAIQVCDCNGAILSTAAGLVKDRGEQKRVLFIGHLLITAYRCLTQRPGRKGNDCESGCSTHSFYKATPGTT
jgi:hypothetical protein